MIDECLTSFSQQTLGTFLGTLGTFANRALLFLETLVHASFTKRLLRLVFAGLSIKVIIGWIYSRDEMKATSRAIFNAGKQVAAPILFVVAKFWDLVSNPWKLVGYAVVICVVRVILLLLIIIPDTNNKYSLDSR
jgi:hypothetical protein